MHSFQLCALGCICFSYAFSLKLILLKCRHLGDNAELVVIPNAGHAFNIEKPKEYYTHLKSFLVDLQPTSTSLPSHTNDLLQTQLL